MAEIPPDMMTRGRPKDPAFRDDETLYRRFRPDDLDGRRISPDAVELPDMSVNRSKYGPPDWLLLGEEFLGWGVFGFTVGDIPPQMVDKGVVVYTFAPEHVPLKYNYPHSEVWAFRE